MHEQSCCVLTKTDAFLTFPLTLPSYYRKVPNDTVESQLSGHQALDTLSSALFQEDDEGKYSPKIEGGDQLLTSNVSSVTLLFQNKVMLLLKIMLIYDEVLLSGQPPLSGHMPVTILLGTLRRR